MKEKIKGEVKWFNEEKGYGFITGDAGKDYFFHYSDVVMTGHKILFQEDRVEFSVEETEKGLSAKEIVRLIEKI